MNKEMQKLLKAINDKKNEVKSLVNDGKLDKAKAAKEELKELQEKFDLLFDLDEEEHEEIEDKVATGTAKTIEAKADKKNLVKAFVNIVKCGFLKREPDEGDVKVYKDALSTDTTKGDDDEMGIGVTVPEDIRTDIMESRERKVCCNLQRTGAGNDSRCKGVRIQASFVYGRLKRGYHII